MVVSMQVSNRSFYNLPERVNNNGETPTRSPLNSGTILFLTLPSQLLWDWKWGWYYSVREVKILQPRQVKGIEEMKW